MSYVPDANAYGMLSDLGTKIATGFKEAQQKQLLSALGQDLMGGDYQSAAAKALAAGDMPTGLKLMELHQQKQQAAAFPSLFSNSQPQPGASPAQAAEPKGSDLSAAPMPASAGQLPAGMRNNNPGNIKFTSTEAFPGVVGPSKNTDQGDPQAVFATPEAGMAAMYSLAKRKYESGKTTPAALIAGNMGWTPGNMQAAANVAKTMGIGLNDDLQLNNPAMAQKFMRALMLQEHGGASRLYGDDMVARAVGSGPAPSSAMAFAANRRGFNVPGAVKDQPAQNPADYQDDGEEDKPAANAQVAQGAVPAVPGAAPKAAKSDDGENAAEISSLRGQQAKLTQALAVFTGPGQKEAITQRLQQIKDRLTELKPDKEKYQIVQTDEGYRAINKSDPSQFQDVKTGTRPKSAIEYDSRKAIAADLGLTGAERKLFLANGSLPEKANKDIADANRQREAEADRLNLQGEDRQMYVLNGKLPSQAEKQTEGQANAALYARRMAEAEKVLSRPEIVAASMDRVQMAKSAVPFSIGNSMVSREYQMADQAKRDFVNATLRRESGAAISASEFENADKQYFPQPGDSREVLAQKAKNRRTAMEGIANAAAPSFREEFFGTKKPGLGVGLREGGKGGEALPDPLGIR